MRMARILIVISLITSTFAVVGVPPARAASHVSEEAVSCGPAMTPCVRVEVIHSVHSCDATSCYLKTAVFLFGATHLDPSVTSLPPTWMLPGNAKASGLVSCLTGCVSAIGQLYAGCVWGYINGGCYAQDVELTPWSKQSQCASFDVSVIGDAWLQVIQHGLGQIQQAHTTVSHIVQACQDESVRFL